MIERLGRKALEGGLREASSSLGGALGVQSRIQRPALEADKAAGLWDYSAYAYQRALSDPRAQQAATRF